MDIRDEEALSQVRNLAGNSTYDDVWVLIPVYNDQIGLSITLNSLKQSAEYSRVLIVDDGSSSPVVGGSDDPRVHVLRLPINRGIVGALNAGIEVAILAGVQFIARIDAGDEYVAGRIHLQIDQMNMDPDLALVGSAAIISIGENRFVFHPITEKSLLHRALAISNQFIHPSVLIRTSSLEKLGSYDPRFQYAEDYELFYRLSREFNVANIDFVGVNYHVSSNSISSRKRIIQKFRKLMVQFHHRSNWNVLVWLGILRSFASFAVPRSQGLFWMRARSYIRRCKIGSNSEQ